ncbi:MAG: hypothetical protein CM15mV86_120 [uncultured marine virus]|nr:MAG: hypothetical protein CM15mV86_120 [uncultured marine virus]
MSILRLLQPIHCLRFLLTVTLLAVQILYSGDSSGTSDDRLVFGAGSDLQIYHDGTDSFISSPTHLAVYSLKLRICICKTVLVKMR